jgi:hypothetical protein
VESLKVEKMEKEEVGKLESGKEEKGNLNLLHEFMKRISAASRWVVLDWKLVHLLYMERISWIFEELESLKVGKQESGKLVREEVGKLEREEVGKLESWKGGKLEREEVGKLESWKGGKGQMGVRELGRDGAEVLKLKMGDRELLKKLVEMISKDNTDIQELEALRADVRIMREVLGDWEVGKLGREEVEKLVREKVGRS